MGTVRILYRASTISLQVVVHPEHMLGALNMKEEEDTIILHNADTARSFVIMANEVSKWLKLKNFESLLMIYVFQWIILIRKKICIKPH